MKRAVKILIVEDEALPALVLFEELKLDGYDLIDPVSTGEDAVRVALDFKPDVILMDVSLVGAVDGIEAARRILEQISTAVIFMTGYSSGEMKRRLDQLPHSGFIDKPVLVDNVRTMINSLVLKTR